MIAWRLQQTTKTIEETPEAHRAAAQRAKSYAEFQAKYYDDPAGFVLDCIEWVEGKGPEAYQLEILRAVPREKRVCARGPHGLGKTTINAWLILWFALTRDGKDWKMPTTAGAWRQLQKFLWPEVHKWARSLRWDIIGRMPFDTRTELQTMSLKLQTGEAFAVASDNPELIEGAHADSLFYIYDESKAIKEATFDAAEGAFAGSGEAYAVAASTPGEPQGRFYDIQRRKAGYEDWWVRAVSKDELIAAGRMPADWAKNRALQWGKDSAIYQRRVEGNFASDDEAGVIPLSWVEAAHERWAEWVEAGKPGELEALGIDVGGGGDGDPSALSKRYRVREAEKLPGILSAWDNLEYDPSGDPLSIGSLAARTLTRFPALRCVVDAIGLGAGTTSDLRRQGFSRIIGFIAGGAAKDPKGNKKLDKNGEFGFADNRSWMWWRAREALNPVTGDGWALPPDDRLTGDLTAPKWREAGAGNIRVESKDDIRKRLKRSTDAADAVLQTEYDEPEAEAPPRRRAGSFSFGSWN
jgi:hypothetical protein